MSVSCCPPLRGQHSSRWPGRPRHLPLEGLGQQQQLSSSSHSTHPTSILEGLKQKLHSSSNSHSTLTHHITTMSAPQSHNHHLHSCLMHSTRDTHPLHPMACIMWHCSITTTTTWTTMYIMHHTTCIPCIPLPLTSLGVEEARACTPSGHHREARGGNPPCLLMVVHSLLGQKVARAGIIPLLAP